MKKQVEASPVKPAKLIFNPHAGQKRRLISRSVTSLEEIKDLFTKYQIPVDLFPTKAPGDATRLAGEAAKEGYEIVIAAGGDGTISEVAQSLVGTNLTLGILPLGSFMNIARMLSIPVDLEKAVMILKMKRTRQVDVGKITYLSKGNRPFYFLENSSIGVEAELQHSLMNLEQSKYREFIDRIKSVFEYYKHGVRVVVDGKEMVLRATMVAVSNGPYTGAALEVAPRAKLNDHLLTVTIFQMTKKELLNHFLRLMGGKKSSAKITRYKAKRVEIYTRLPKHVHADARVFGTTPVVYEVIPGALTFITGFPEPSDHALKKRTLLDP